MILKIWPEKKLDENHHHHKSKDQNMMAETIDTQKKNRFQDFERRKNFEKQNKKRRKIARSLTVQPVFPFHIRSN